MSNDASLIDRVAAYLIFEQKQDNKNFLVVDFSSSQTTFHAFEIKNKQFYQNPEIIFQNPMAIQDIFKGIHKGREKEFIKELLDPDAQVIIESNDNSYDDMILPNSNLTMAVLKESIKQWVIVCKNIQYKLSNPKLLVIGNEFTEILSVHLAKALNIELVNTAITKEMITKRNWKASDINIYPKLTKDISFRLYTEGNKAHKQTLLKAGTDLKIYTQPHYLSQKTWIIINMPVLPQIFVGEHPINCTAIDLNNFDLKAEKRIVPYSLKQFELGVSVTKYQEINLFIKDKNNIETIINLGQCL